MLETCPANTVLFRHYGWTTPAISFGYFQKYAEVHQEVPIGFEAIRRPTGGGIVNHKRDWTYALVIPCSHKLYRSPAPETYKEIHLALAETLRKHKVHATLQPDSKCTQPQLACFTIASSNDVIDQKSKKKIAGAALKRTQQGLLVQGTIDMEIIHSLNKSLDWYDFNIDFIHILSQKLGTSEPAFLKVPPKDPVHSPLFKKLLQKDWNTLR